MAMAIKAAPGYWRSLLLVAFLGTSLSAAHPPGGVVVSVGGLKRISPKQTNFEVSITNNGETPIFLAGINYESGPSPELVFIEHERERDEWLTINCMDTEPPDTIRLNAGETITRKIWWELPMSVVCGNPVTSFEGRFRIQVRYFQSDAEVRAYLKKLFSNHWKEARAAAAFSEPFEVPPYQH
ncbi:MAG TPA: hypothetical protein VEH50_10185 [Methylomirabilota bacterium]|nr:hypothetical protein [Methylomirabilota bacterium]